MCMIKSNHSCMGMLHCLGIITLFCWQADSLCSCQTAVTWFYVVNHHIWLIHRTSMYNWWASVHYFLFTHYSCHYKYFNTCKCYYMQIYGGLLGFFYGVLKRLLALGVWSRKCKRPHKLAPLNHCIMCISIWEQQNRHLFLQKCQC